MALGEILATRLCHDLSGLVGTISGLLELAAEDGTSSEAFSMAADGAKTLSGRLQLMRAAWGSAREHDAAALAGLLTHAAGQPRVRTDWSAVLPGQFPAATARLLLNIGLTGMEAMPRGGVVRFAGRPDGAVIVSLDGPGAAWPAGWIDAIAAVDGAPEDPAPPPPGIRSFQPDFTLRLARLHGRLSLLLGSGFTAPALLVPA